MTLKLNLKKGDKVRLTHAVRTVAYTIPKGTEGTIHSVEKDGTYLVEITLKDNIKGLKMCSEQDMKRTNAEDRL